jgi:osmotically-inducible protein OsmY
MDTHGNEVIGQVRHAIALDPKLDAPKITLTMIGDTLALAGVLDTPDEVSHAEVIARKAAPGVTIDNGLTVSERPNHLG